MGLPEGDLDEIYAGAEADEVGHLPGRDAGRHLDHDDVAVIAGEQLRERDPVLQSERAYRGECDRLGGGEGGGAKLGRIEMNPADSETSSRRPETIGEGDEARLAATDDDDPVQLRPFDVLLDDRAFTRRVRKRVGETFDEVVTIVDDAYAALAAGVDRLENRGEPDAFEPPECLIGVCNYGELGLRDSMLSQAEAHGGLVGHAARGLDADPGQAEPLGNRGGDRDGAVARDRDDGVDGVAPADLDDPFQVVEVGRFRDVGHVETDRRRIAVDGDDAPSGFAGLAHCSELGDAPPEEHGRHAGDPWDRQSADSTPRATL